MSISTKHGKVKHVAYNFSDPQVKVREATSNDPWGPSTALMSEIADLTHNPMAFTEIMSIVWKRLNDSGKNWRHVYKSLVLLDFLIKCGHEKVAQQCRENIFTIEKLKDFQHVEDSRDQGLNIREKAKQITSLLSDDEQLKNERTRFILTRNKFKQNNPGPVGAESRRCNRHHISDPELDPEHSSQAVGTNELRNALPVRLMGNSPPYYSKSSSPTTHNGPTSGSPSVKKNATWKDFVVVPGVDEEHESISMVKSIPNCCRRKYTKDVHQTDESCIADTFRACINDDFRTLKKLKKAYFVHISKFGYICIQCHGMSGCQIKRSKRTESKPMDILQATRHLASKNCGARKNEQRSANVFIFYLQANKKLLASTEFVRNGGKFDYGKFDKMIEGPKESSDEEYEYKYVSNDDAGFPVTPKNGYLPLSIASKYPCREDVRQWEKSFESLLNNKFGCALFRHFLSKEFSAGTKEFLYECKEFRKMRKGKRSTKQKAIEIYNEFVAEHSPKQIELDSDTRAATRAAVEGGCKPDTFDLAQNRVEQLMSKDSYRRFLRDRLFLDLLESNDNKGIRSKIDLSLSTSSLYPSQEDVCQWEKSFECLLKNIYGCALFRHFLKKEHSHQNMTFWLECEEFKKMKDGKKSTTQKAIEIYSEFVAEHSPKEVNLDSDTRAATLAAVEGGCKPDTFDLAQNRVEQLMSKDSYRRFLRDRLFLDFLESYDDKDDKASTSKD